MKWFDYLLSTRAMALLLLLMASAVGVATFIENSYDTITAKVLIYNAKWFELILFLLLINFINNIKTYQLLKWKKWSILMLHIGFIITLIGYYSNTFSFSSLFVDLAVIDFFLAAASLAPTLKTIF